MTHTNWRILSDLLSLPQSSIHFIEPEGVVDLLPAGRVLSRRDFLIPFAAMRFGRPVCWIEDRSEHLKATNQSREQRHRIKIGVQRDGTIVAMEAEILFNMGAYTRTHGATRPSPRRRSCAVHTGSKITAATFSVCSPTRRRLELIAARGATKPTLSASG